ncbi:MAG: hypothetical protein Kow0037_23680 [Calditrichia bacterium]
MEVYSVKSNSNEAVSASLPKLQAQGSLPKSNHASKASEVIQDVHEKARVEFPKMQEIAQKVRDKLKVANVNIQFEVNERSNRIIVKVVDPETGEVLRRIPPETLSKSLEYLNQLRGEVKRHGAEVDVKY